MLFNRKKIITPAVGKHFVLDEESKKKTAIAINRIIGQLEAVKADILNDQACDETLTQVLAIKGGASKIGLDLLSMGVLSCFDKYSEEELLSIFKNMFKLN